MFAKDCIDFSIPILDSNRIDDALGWCEQFHSNYYYVLFTSKKIKGIISEEQLLDSNTIDIVPAQLLPLGDKLVYEHTHLFELFRIIDNQNNSILPVVDKQKKVLGFTSADSILKIQLQHNILLQKGGVLILELPPKDLSITEIARIIESNNAQLLHYQLIENKKLGTYYIHLKINQSDLTAIASTFERFEYTISEIIHHSEQDKQYQERVANLLKYLEL